MRNTLCLFLGLLILFSGLQAQPLTSDQEARIQQLEKIIQQQESRIQDLQKKVGVVQQQSREYTDQVIDEYMSRPEAQETKPVAGYEPAGFFIRMPDGKMEVYLSGYVQFGLAIFENDTPENNTFYPNGVYLAFDAYAYDHWHGRIQLNFAGTGGLNSFSSGGDFAGLTLQDAYMEYMYDRADPMVNVR